jgi:predicted ester cyclase
MEPTRCDMLSMITPVDENQVRNLAVVRQLLEAALGRGDVGLLPELVAPDYVGHLPIGDHYGPEGVRIDITAYRAALPDLTLTIEELFELDDRVVRRYTIRGTHRGPLLGLPPTDQPIELRAIAIDRLEAGRLVESWVMVCGP